MKRVYSPRRAQAFHPSDLKKWMALIAIVICCAAVHAGALPGNLQFHDDGTFGAADFRCVMSTVGCTWSQGANNSDWKNRQFRIEDGSRISSGNIPLGEGGTGQITITPTGENCFRYQFQAKFPPAQKFQSVHLQCKLPLALRNVSIDDKPFELPENQTGAELLKYSNIKTLAIPLRDGSKLTFSGNLRLMIQDSRLFGGNSFEFRLAAGRNADGTFALDVNVELLRDRFAPEQVYRKALGQPEIRVEGEKWARVDFKRETVPGSALDFSFLIDAPAGKYGRVITGPDGFFEYADRPGAPVRFYGGNLSWNSVLLDHPMADRVVAELVKQGYNWARAHQTDTQMRPAGSQDSTALDPEKLDRWDYFIYRMKESGIYFTTDIYSSREFQRGDPGLAKYAGKKRIMKPLLAFSSAAMENWKAYARNLLTHVNPYTKLPLTDDPALVCLNLVNEDYFVDWSDPLVVDFYRDAFKRYCDERGLSGREMKNSDRIFVKFRDELQRKVLQEQIDFVKNELKVKCPITSISAEPQTYLTIARSMFDFTDVHLYYAHPTWKGGRMMSPQAQRSALSGEDCASFLKCWMPSRLWGKPLVSTEFRYCWPSRYRAEQGLLIGAYGALQGYDGLCGYGYSEGDKGLSEVRHIVNSFETCNDPLALFSDRMAELLYLRGDVAPAKNRVAVRIPENLLDREDLPLYFPMAFRDLGLITGIGATVGKPIPGIPTLELADCADPGKLADPQLQKLWRKAEQTGLFESDTGEILLKRDTFLRVTTPLSECVSTFNTAGRGNILEVNSLDGPATVGLHSLDRQPLDKCGSAVLFHLTETANTGERYQDESLVTQLAGGQLPLLVRRSKAEITLNVTKPFRVLALSCDGGELGEIPSRFDGKQQRFTVRTDGFPGGVMAYALKRK